MKKINKEIEENLDIVLEAPHTTCVKRVDEVQAARAPDVTWKKTGD
jgi:glycine dehydrogenase subunit 2